MTEHEAAVLDAAGKWVAAKEAVLAVDEERVGDLAERDRDSPRARPGGIRVDRRGIPAEGKGTAGPASRRLTSRAMCRSCRGSARCTARAMTVPSPSI